MCDHKNVKKYRKIQNMEMGLYRKIIDQIAEERPDARVWQIFFGDPFMCRDMPERIRYAKEKGLRDVVLNSNGVMMTEKRARGVIEAGLDAMYVGIDAAYAETYRRIRVGGNFHKAVQNVLNYRDLLVQYGKANQKLFVQFVVSDINEGEVEAFKRYWRLQGVNVKIRPKVSWAGLVEATNLRENRAVTRKPCYWLMRTLNICADGQVALCSVDVHCRVNCGDANAQTLKAIWNGKLKGFRALQKAGNFGGLPAMCRDCPDWQSGYAELFTARNGSGCEEGNERACREPAAGR
jgi:MoaA/NifB/PqqE/SkfB family radical SAM enzyme